MEEAAGKRSSPSSWVSLTTVPYEDGYEWRKYGEKRINGTSHTRSYFRCTYRDDTGCQATKHVQQQQPLGDDGIISDPPVFQVTYNNKHTCNCNSRSAVMNDIKQEEEQAPVALPLPPLVEALDFERTPLPYRLELVSSSYPNPTNMQQFCGAVLRDHCCNGDTAAAAASSTTATSPCISGDSAWDDEYSAWDMMLQMAAAAEEAPAAGDHEIMMGHDTFYDPDIFLLCESFKDY